MVRYESNADDQQLIRRVNAMNPTQAKDFLTNECGYSRADLTHANIRLWLSLEPDPCEEIAFNKVLELPEAVQPVGEVVMSKHAQRRWIQ